MKKTMWFVLGAGILFLGPVWAALPVGQTAHVQVRTTPVRETPSFLGSPVTELAYGDRVTILDERGPWREVSPSRWRKGWVHISALTSRPVRLSGGEADAEVGATGDEIAIAGKGFNEQVEKAFQSSGTEADFTWVDRAEKITVSPREIRRFLSRGGLREPVQGETP